MKLEELHKMLGRAVMNAWRKPRGVTEVLPFVPYEVRLRTQQNGQVMESAIEDVEIDHEQRVVYIDEATPVVPAGCWPKKDAAEKMLGEGAR